MLRAHQMGFEFGKLPFMKCRKPLKKQLAGHKAKNGIPQKFKLFIVLLLHRIRTTGFGFFMRVGAVRQGPLEHLRALKRMSQCGLQRSKVGLDGNCAHCGSCGSFWCMTFANPVSRSCSTSASFCSSGFELASCNAWFTE